MTLNSQLFNATNYLFRKQVAKLCIASFTKLALNMAGKKGSSILVKRLIFQAFWRMWVEGEIGMRKKSEKMYKSYCE
ncbi:MAG: hypothetical protein S4CHLAM102_11820 [Chlamydiia bacterium]|nr:hypothetical protein [Chlamydiia bacterium]